MAMRYPGGFISSTAPTVNANTAKGVWTLEEAMQYIRAGQWPVPTGNGDPYFQYNTMLLPGQGTNGAQNNTFLDSSTNNFTITRNGNTTQGTFTPFSGANGYWSLYVGGAGYQTWTTATNYSGTDITVECWVYATAATTSFTSLVSSNSGTGNYNQYFNLAIDGSNRLACNVYGASNTALNNTSTIPLNQWVHCAFVLTSGGTLSLYENGVRVATTSSASIASVTTNIQVGGIVQTSGGTYISYFNGYISNARINRSAVYSGASFSVPTSPLTNNANTNLLVCQSNRVVDNSGNNYTASSALTITPFQPFGAPTVAYSASTVGGSGYFDGSGDVLSIANTTALQFGTGDFTVEAWVYLTATPGAQYAQIIGRTEYGTNADWMFQVTNSRTLTWYMQGSYVATSTGTIPLNAWTQVAVTRSGSSIRLFINGTIDGTATNSGSTENTASGDYTIGADQAGDEANLTGYIASLRVTKGGALYTSNFTPSTAPLTTTVSSGTVSLLTNFTNAGIIDNAQKNDLETVGGAQISTTQYKWGASSMYFDGTGDWVQVPYSSSIDLGGTTPFTIEFWIYSNSLAARSTVLARNNGSTAAGSQFDLNIETTGQVALYFYTGSSSISTTSATGAITTATWIHVALTKDNFGNYKIFINGNQSGSTTTNTSSINLPTIPMTVGAQTTSGSSPINAYIQDLRITKGYARYPYNFTAPTAAFPLFWQAAATPSSDPYFDYTTLLLPGNGTNGAQNNTFLDSSTNAFTITRNGNTTQGTFTPFSQTGWSNYFDGTGDYLVTPSNAAFGFGTGDATIEAWLYPTTVAGTQVFLDTRVGSAAGIGFYLSGATLSVAKDSTTVLAQGGDVIANAWNHVVWSRQGTSNKLFLNGVETKSVTDSTNYPTAKCVIGISDGVTQPFTGYISNVRVVKGTAVYTGTSFTVPTSPLTAVSGTSLLTCQSNRFIDNSTNAFTITRNGDTSVQAFSPFNPTASYSTSTVGGSGYFDAAGDYLTGNSSTLGSASTSTFTIDGWVYPTSFANTIYVIGDMQPTSTANYMSVNVTTSGVVDFYWFDGAVKTCSSTGTMKLNQWNWFSVVVNSNAITIYVNSTSSGQSGTTTLTTRTGTNDFALGAFNQSATPNAYFSAIRVSTIARTVSSIPTAPPASDSDTRLLLNFTNGGIIDNTAKNNLETVGGASISTTVSKFGGSSMYFDGSGDQLVMPASQNFEFGSGDFTVECWVYITGTSGSIINYSNGQSANSNFCWEIYQSSSTVVQTTMVEGSTVYTASSSSFSLNAWNHVAAVRYGNTLRIYVNGIVGGTTATVTGVSVSVRSGTTVKISGYNNATAMITGYINDLRLTKGIGRYTQNFTPPTTAFLTL